MKRLFITFVILIFSIFFCNKQALAEEEILILFDASTSMMYTLGDQPKYIQMVEVAKKILSKTSPQQKIGLRVIGIPINAKMLNYIANWNDMCKATELVTPIGRNNIEAINMNLDAIFPLGLSPITYSLATAISSDFSIGADPKHIILITDGAEGCGMDPCKYVKEITAVRRDVKIDIIAIGVDDSEEIKQLQCIATATGGEVKNAKTPQEMDAAFLSTMVKFSSNAKFTTLGSYSNQHQIRYKNYMIEVYQ